MNSLYFLFIEENFIIVISNPIINKIRITALIIKKLSVLKNSIIVSIESPYPLLIFLNFFSFVYKDKFTLSPLYKNFILANYL